MVNMSDGCDNANVRRLWCLHDRQDDLAGELLISVLIYPSGSSH